MKKNLFLFCLFFIGLVFLSGCNPSEPEGAGDNIAQSNNHQNKGNGSESDTLEDEESLNPADDDEDTQEDAGIIFYNGVILTIDDEFSQIEAVYVEGEKIVALGSESEVMAYKADKTIMIDLQGKTLMPGFVDSHSHILDTPSNPATDTLEKAQALALQNGITTLGDMATSPESLEKIQSFDRSGKLRVRTSMYLVYINACGDVWGDWVKERPPTREPGEMLRLGGVKVFTDGGSCGFPAVSFDRSDGGQGDLWFGQEEFNTIIFDLDASGYQIAIHAIGDRGVDLALNAIDFTLSGGSNTMRHRIEHNTTVSPVQLGRYQELGVAATVVGSVWSCDPWYGGPDPLENQAWNFPYRAMLDAYPDAHIGWHTDFPWSSVNPLNHLYSLVTPFEVAGDLMECSDPEWIGNKTVTLEEALRMMTTGAAYSLFREEEVGSLEPGKYADLIIISGDLSGDPDAIKDYEVLMTMVGGEVGWCAPGAENYCP